MKFIEAKYEDVCMVCADKIHVGDVILWERKNSRHAECIEGVVSRWMKNGKR